MKRLFIYIFLTGVNLAHAQSVYELLVNSFHHAEYLYKKHAYAKAAYYYEKSYNQDTTNKNAAIGAAKSNKRIHNIVESRFWFGKLEHRNSESLLYAPDNVHDYFDVLMMAKDTAQIHAVMKKIQNHELDTSVAKVFHDLVIPQKDFYADSSSSTVVKLPYNSSFDEICPFIYNKQLVFISNRPAPSLIENNLDSSGFYQFYTVPADFKKTNEFQPEPWKEVRAIDHEGPITIFDNGNKAIVAQNVFYNAQRRLALFLYTKNSKGNWDSKGKLPFCLKTSSYSHPFFHDQSKTLYFVELVDNVENTDIFSVKFNNGNWDKPTSLGISVNTVRSELFPYVSKDSKLYFASNGRNGLGGFDIFSIQLDSMQTDAINLGYPINSAGDDLCLMMLPNGRDGYFSSNRNADNKDDIFRVLIHQIRYNVSVKDKLKGTPIKSGSIKVVDYKTDQVVTNKKLAAKNELIIKPGRKYIIEVQSPNFRTVSFPVLFMQKNDTSINKSVFMEKINKTFVKGKVVNDGEPQAQANIKILDISADSVETVTSRSDGTFVCEINRDTTTYFFITAKDSDSCVYRYVPLKKFKRGSGVAFLDLELTTMKFKSVALSIVDSNKVELKDSLWLRNDFTRQKLLIYPLTAPMAKLSLWDKSHYSFMLKNTEGELVVYKTFASDKCKKIGILFTDKYFIKPE